MDRIETWNDLKASLLTGFNGRQGTHAEADVVMLVACLRERPWPHMSREDDPMSPAMAWEIIYDRRFMFHDDDTGWVTREGLMLGAGYGSHERLLDHLGIATPDAERWGWVRVSRIFRYQCMFSLSKAQVARLSDIGMQVDKGDERLQPAFPALDMMAEWKELFPPVREWLMRPFSRTRKDIRT